MIQIMVYLVMFVIEKEMPTARSLHG